MHQLDLVIKNGMVLDGLSTHWRIADIGVAGDRIATVAPHIDPGDAEVVDASDHIVCPGFIDMHAHADIQILVNPEWDPGVAQGVTTVIVGQDGLGPAPISDETRSYLRSHLEALNGTDEVEWGWATVAEYLTTIQRAGPTPNIGMLAPHGTIRMNVMGLAEGPPTQSELVAMRASVATAMDEGCFGLSSGLTYAPGMFADDDELAALCSVVGRRGGFYSTHHRNYGAEALREYAACLEIGRLSGCPVHLTHANIVFDVNRGRASDLLALVDEARDRGEDVTLDSYPYTAGSTFLHALLPSWFQLLGRDVMIRKLGEPSTRAQLQHQIEVEGSDGFHNIPIDWSRIQISSLRNTTRDQYLGMSIRELSLFLDKSPFDAFADLITEEQLNVGCIADIGFEEDVAAIMRHPAHMVGSDSIVVGQRPHPRAWGTFVRCLEYMANEQRIVRPEEMVRKMTASPADRLGIFDRGTLRPGSYADIVVFDPAGVHDNATYETPRRFPDGIPHVIINGVFAKRDGDLLHPQSGVIVKMRGR